MYCSDTAIEKPLPVLPVDLVYDENALPGIPSARAATPAQANAR